jgi:hypothetical protein
VHSFSVTRDCGERNEFARRQVVMTCQTGDPGTARQASLIGDAMEVASEEPEHTFDGEHGERQRLQDAHE